MLRTNLTRLADEAVSAHYDYEVSEGITAERANEWSERLNNGSLGIDKYRTITWIPREFLLCLLSNLTPNELIKECENIDHHRGRPPRAVISELVNLVPADRDDDAFAVNRMRLNVALVKNKMRETLALCIDNRVSAVDLASLDTRIGGWLKVAVRAHEARDI